MTPVLVIDLEATFGRSLDGEDGLVGADLEGVDVSAAAASCEGHAQNSRVGCGAALDGPPRRRATAACRSSAKLSSRPVNLPASIENLL